MSVADDLVAAFAPWMTDDLEAYLRTIGEMFAEVEMYSDDSEEFEGWTILLDPDRCPVAALPYLAQFVGERLPKGLAEAAQRQWIKDAPNQRRGTVSSIVRAAARRLTGAQLVTVIERDGGPDKLSVITYDKDTNARRNLCTNPKGGALATTGWTNVSLPTFEAIAVPTTAGLPSGVATGFHCIGNASNDLMQFNLGVEAGKRYRLSRYLRVRTLGGATAVQVRIRNPAGANVVPVVSVTAVGGSFLRYDLDITATATENWRCEILQNGAGAAEWDATAFLFEISNTLEPYFDGDFADAEWLGASNASVSLKSDKSAVLRELLTVVPADISLTYTVSPGQTWSQVLVAYTDWNDVEASAATWDDLGAATPEGTYSR